MNITLKKDWHGFKEGEQISVSESRAEYLDRLGYCEYKKKKPEVKKPAKKKKTEDKKTADK